MTNERPETTSNAKVAGSGAAASGSGVAAGKKGIAAGRDVKIYKITQVKSYMTDKGPLAYKGMGNPAQAWESALAGEMGVTDLREMLLNDPVRREELKRQPRTVSVRGLLYPSALLVSGWWESRMQKIEGAKWHNGLQEWLFSGFHSWGPSWDFTWDFERPENQANKPAFVAQLGEGDEANSIPVIIPADKAEKLTEKFLERGRERRYCDRYRRPVPSLSLPRSGTTGPRWRHSRLLYLAETGGKQAQNIPDSRRTRHLLRLPLEVPDAQRVDKGRQGSRIEPGVFRLGAHQLRR